jgi:hypothetical protein
MAKCRARPSISRPSRTSSRSSSLSRFLCRRISSARRWTADVIRSTQPPPSHTSRRSRKRIDSSWFVTFLRHSAPVFALCFFFLCVCFSCFSVCSSACVCAQCAFLCWREAGRTHGPLIAVRAARVSHSACCPVASFLFFLVAEAHQVGRMQGRSPPSLVHLHDEHQPAALALQERRRVVLPLRRGPVENQLRAAVTRFVHKSHSLTCASAAAGSGGRVAGGRGTEVAEGG